MNIMKKFAKRALRSPANMLVSSSSNLLYKVKGAMADLTMEEPSVAAKFLPFKEGQGNYILDAVNKNGGTRSIDVPAPPEDLWQGYGPTAKIFLESGKTHVQIMRDLVAQSNFPLQAGYRILDLGCGAGRMIRFFDDIAEQCEIWGLDISAEHIIWCHEHLSPPFNFAVTTTFPHLPFEDRYFDFIYCGSVFTHIADLADAWLLELRRVTRPNGRIYITIHDNSTIKSLVETRPQWWLTELLNDFNKTSNVMNSKFSMFTVNRGPRTAQVFYDIDYIRQHWGRLFRIQSVTPGAYDHQTAILLER